MNKKIYFPPPPPGLPAYIKTLYGALIENFKKVSYGTSAPTSGYWERGDICWNLEPSAGGPPAWQCVSSGRPGTWKAFPNLAS